jgi:hypothetical protein
MEFSEIELEMDVVSRSGVTYRVKDADTYWTGKRDAILFWAYPYSISGRRVRIDETNAAKYRRGDG